MWTRTLLLSTLVLASSNAAGDDEPYSRRIPRSALPEPAVVTAFRDEPTAFVARMEKGRIVEIRPVVPPLVANFEMRLIERNDDSTLVEIRSSLAGKIKFDLHISADDEVYIYTSSCPLFEGASTMEHWPFRIDWFAVSNIRQVADDAGTCE
jgi:hypothetical protein